MGLVGFATLLLQIRGRTSTRERGPRLSHTTNGNTSPLGIMYCIFSGLHLGFLHPLLDSSVICALCFRLL